MKKENMSKNVTVVLLHLICPKFCIYFVIKLEKNQAVDKLSTALNLI